MRFTHFYYNNNNNIPVEIKCKYLYSVYKHDDFKDFISKISVHIVYTISSFCSFFSLTDVVKHFSLSYRHFSFGTIF